MIPFGKPQVDSKTTDLVSEVINSGLLVHGKYTALFEKKFAERVGCKHAIAVSSCTAGLHLSLFVNNISNGDYVALPAMTHVATAHAVELQNATPIFVDVDSNTGNISIKELEKVSKKYPLKAIIPVHYLGLPCEMKEINDLAKLHNALVIEDCALALDGQYDNKKAGNLGDLGSFSFYPVKHLTSIEGGMVTTNNDKFANLIKKTRAFGYNKELGQRSRPGIYDVDLLGFNYRMNEVEAAVGLTQLEKLDNMQLKRKNNFESLSKNLLDINCLKTFPSLYNKSKSSHYCFNIVVKKEAKFSRDELQDFLKDNGIGTSIHYPSSVPTFSYYASKYGYKKGDFPNSDYFGDNTISLPIAPHVKVEDINYISEKLHQFVSSK